MKMFTFSSLVVIFVMMMVLIPLESEGFTAGGGGNIPDTPARKRSEFSVRFKFGSLRIELLLLLFSLMCLFGTSILR